MHHIGTNADLVAPLLIGCLTNNDSQTAVTAANLLGRIKGNPYRAIPALVNCLSATNTYLRYQAVYALGYFPEQADRVEPELIQMLTDPASLVRHTATNALRRINSAAVPKESGTRKQ
jgi:HEAT repeat protein